MTAQNELDATAKGGTELLGDLLEKIVDPKLLEDVEIIRSRFRGFNLNKEYHIFWEHDLPDDPESKNVFSNQEIVNKLNAIVFVSHWQKNAFLERYPSTPKEKCVVILNAIDPIDISQRSDVDEKIRLIYTPTPHRGLEILVPVFEALCNKFPNQLHLDVYSSFKLYGWETRDEPYRKLFDKIKNHPDMTYHGTVSNEEIRKALVRSDIFVYPSIWQETSCLCLIEAMSAGCQCVCSDLAALPETSGGLIPIYSYTGNLNRDAQSFYSVLEALIEYHKTTTSKEQLVFNKLYIDYLHNSTRMKLSWESLLTAVKGNKQ